MIKNHKMLGPMWEQDVKYPVVRNMQSGIWIVKAEKRKIFKPPGGTRNGLAVHCTMGQGPGLTVGHPSRA